MLQVSCTSCPDCAGCSAHAPRDALFMPAGAPYALATALTMLDVALERRHRSATFATSIWMSMEALSCWARCGDMLVTKLQAFPSRHKVRPPIAATTACQLLSRHRCAARRTIADACQQFAHTHTHQLSAAPSAHCPSPTRSPLRLTLKGVSRPAMQGRAATPALCDHPSITPKPSATHPSFCCAGPLTASKRVHADLCSGT